MFKCSSFNTRGASCPEFLGQSKGAVERDIFHCEGRERLPNDQPSDMHIIFVTFRIPEKHPRE